MVAYSQDICPPQKWLPPNNQWKHSTSAYSAPVAAATASYSDAKHRDIEVPNDSVDKSSWESSAS